jgi:hypothetical protein
MSRNRDGLQAPTLHSIDEWTVVNVIILPELPRKKMARIDHFTGTVPVETNTPKGLNDSEPEGLKRRVT